MLHIDQLGLRMDAQSPNLITELLCSGFKMEGYHLKIKSVASYYSVKLKIFGKTLDCGRVEFVVFAFFCNLLHIKVFL